MSFLAGCMGTPAQARLLLSIPASVSLSSEAVPKVPRPHSQFCYLFLIKHFLIHFQPCHTFQAQIASSSVFCSLVHQQQSHQAELHSSQTDWVWDVNLSCISQASVIWIDFTCWHVFWPVRMNLISRWCDADELQRHQAYSSPFIPRVFMSGRKRRWH